MVPVPRDETFAEWVKVQSDRQNAEDCKMDDGQNEIARIRTRVFTALGVLALAIVLAFAGVFVSITL